MEIPEPHCKALLGWMRRQQRGLERCCEREPTDLALDEEVIDQAHQQVVEGEGLYRLGNQLVPILSGRQNSADLLPQDDLLNRLYASSASFTCYPHMVQYVKQLTFKAPQMSVLELCAGTGSASVPLLQALTDSHWASLKRYDFTDLSTEGFNQAQQLLEGWSGIVQFRTLNIEVNPLGQGYSMHYDVVLACDVLHATKSIRTTLRNIRKLLKPGGRLILIEVTRPPTYYNLIFGTLPEWWRGM